eukprot:6487890-Amphidinium_carterae.2
MASTGGMGAAFEGPAMDMPDPRALLPDALERDIMAEEEKKEEKVDADIAEDDDEYDEEFAQQKAIEDDAKSRQKFESMLLASSRQLLSAMEKLHQDVAHELEASQNLLTKIEAEVAEKPLLEDAKRDVSGLMTILQVRVDGLLAVQSENPATLDGYIARFAKESLGGAEGSDRASSASRSLRIAH